MKKITLLFIGLFLIMAGFILYIKSNEVKPVINSILICCVGSIIFGWNLGNKKS